MFSEEAEDSIVYEDDQVAVELGNGSMGAAVYVFHKLHSGSMIRRYDLSPMLVSEEQS